jgi:mono/diheme cytochrome c family protein
MKRALAFALLVALIACGCSRKGADTTPAAKAFGSALVEVSGGKQAANAGDALEQPLVVQVNDAQGNAVAGAAVTLRGPNGIVFTPASGLTDASGQFTATVKLGETSGRYELTAATRDKAGKPVELKLTEIALGYQQAGGRELSERYCARCHNPESTPERVSNLDNLEPKPHPFTAGDTLNAMSDADLIAIISHGGLALNRSPEMPPYGYTLSKAQVQALAAYIRAVADPPYHSAGVVYAKN